MRPASGSSEGLIERVRGLGARELDRIRVKGRRDPVRIYSLLGPADSGGSWLEVWASGLAAYRKGRFGEAARALRELLAERPGDGAAALLLERIASLEKQPPADWDGTWTFEEK